ncbi:GGDEF domain-containing protein [Novosphingobium terrae]|uniref:GGDEF domain-containing protein n=1 Tax=Novosphingobium terrae TaxID=2726189 RepID=UPI00197D4992|nr:GGDEF domain-containing protein [Novosphingobium terrae]
MPQALLPFLVNITIAAMLVASFFTIAQLNPSVRRARWIALCYGLGALNPLGEVAILFGGDLKWMGMIAAGGFLAGITLYSPVMSQFYGKRPWWRAASVIVMIGLVYSWATIGMPHKSLWIDLGFQVPFALGSALCAITTWRHAPPSAMNRVLSGVFVLTALHFLLKPFAALLLGGSVSETHYAHTLYAVVSQSSTGFLMVAAGLLSLITVLQTVVQANSLQARTDLLTSLPNRRALFERFAALTGDRREGAAVGVAVIDIDHFKRINDSFGHAQGDEVLKAVASCLDQNRPSSAMLARIGGEEFVMLLPGLDEQGTLLVCEHLRLAVSRMPPGLSHAVTVSLGLTLVEEGEDLADTLRRADRALYDAKRAGRDRCRVAGEQISGQGQVRLAVVGKG